VLYAAAVPVEFTATNLLLPYVTLDHVVLDGSVAVTHDMPSKLYVAVLVPVATATNLPPPYVIEVQLVAVGNVLEPLAHVVPFIETTGVAESLRTPTNLLLPNATAVYVPVCGNVASAHDSPPLVLDAADVEPELGNATTYSVEPIVPTAALDHA
jgi:hypothetical protein